MNNICCFCETGTRKPEFSMPGLDMRDIASMRVSGFEWCRILDAAKIVLVHSTEDCASECWQEIARQTPTDCIVVEYTDGGSYTLDKTIPEGRQVYWAEHRAIEKNLKRFLENWVEKGSPDMSILLTVSNRQLSMSIHQLENLVLPLRLDVETLEARGTEPDVVEAIWMDYFDANAKDAGFLLSSRAFSKGTSGIENEIAQILGSVRTVPGILEGPARQGLLSAHGFDQTKVSVFLGIEEARTNPDSLKGKAELKQTLTQVRDKIIALSNELRTLRSQLEVEAEGRGS
jgi:hypothetical protein